MSLLWSGETSSGFLLRKWANGCPWICWWLRSPHTSFSAVNSPTFHSLVTSPIPVCPNIYQGFTARSSCCPGESQRGLFLTFLSADDGNCLLLPRGGDVTKLYALRVSVHEGATLTQPSLYRMSRTSSWIFSPVKSEVLLCYCHLGGWGASMSVYIERSRKREKEIHKEVESLGRQKQALHFQDAWVKSLRTNT